MTPKTGEQIQKNRPNDTTNDTTFITWGQIQKNRPYGIQKNRPYDISYDI